MDLIHPQVDGYLRELAEHNDPVLRKMEERAAEEHFPIVGPAAGRFCYQVGRMLGARRVFELGSGYGYSTLWFARAVQENGGGEVHHTVWDEALSQDARRYLTEAGVDGLMHYRVAEAVAALRETEGPFDIIFNDINKDGYPDSYPVMKEKLAPGGVLIVDNMLWHGGIFDPEERSAHAEGVRALTRLVFADPDFSAGIIPIRDGLLLAVHNRSTDTLRADGAADAPRGR